MKVPVRIYIDDPRIYGIYDKENDILYISTNPAGEKGCIFIKRGRRYE